MEQNHRPGEHAFSRDFLTGCLALVVIGIILFILIPLLVLVLKLSVLVVLPIGFLAALVIFTTFFGRIVNILRKKWWVWIAVLGCEVRNTFTAYCLPFDDYSDLTNWSIDSMRLPLYENKWPQVAVTFWLSLHFFLFSLRWNCPGQVQRVAAGSDSQLPGCF